MRACDDPEICADMFEVLRKLKLLMAAPTINAIMAGLPFAATPMSAPVVIPDAEPAPPPAPDPLPLRASAPDLPFDLRQRFGLQ